MCIPMVKDINMFTIKNKSRTCPVGTTLKGTPSVSYLICWALIGMTVAV